MRHDLIQTHSLDPASVLRLVRRMGGRIDRLLLVGCEPSPPDVDDMLPGAQYAGGRGRGGGREDDSGP